MIYPTTLTDGLLTSFSDVGAKQVYHYNALQPHVLVDES